MQLKKQIVLSYGITAIPNTSMLIIPMLDKPRINLRIHLRHDTNLTIWREAQVCQKKTYSRLWLVKVIHIRI